MPLLDYVCREDGCWRSFHTRAGLVNHERDGDHDGDLA